jgi:hypothetical protein
MESREERCEKKQAKIEGIAIYDISDELSAISVSFRVSMSRE